MVLLSATVTCTLYAPSCAADAYGWVRCTVTRRRQNIKYNKIIIIRNEIVGAAKITGGTTIQTAID